MRAKYNQTDWASATDQGRMMTDQAPEVKKEIEASVDPVLTGMPATKGAASVLAYAKLLVNPSYHIRKILEDLKSARIALSQWDLDAFKDDSEALTRAFRGRLFATFLLSGIFGVFGPILGTVNQYVTQSGIEGLFTGLIVANVFGTIGFQIIWWIAHSRMYRSRQAPGLPRFLAMQKDLLPLQWDGLRFTALFLMITVPIMVVLIYAIEHLAAPVARIIPFPVVALFLEVILIHSSLVRVMGDLFEKHAARVAMNYRTDTSAVLKTG